MNIFAKPTGYGWHRYGPCDVCGVNPDSTYMLSSCGTVDVPMIFGCKSCVAGKVECAIAASNKKIIRLEEIRKNVQSK